jgi:dihydroxyacetone kinase-like protein
MSQEALGSAERVVRTIAEAAIANETYFSELDAVVGDGDFGYSLARGFGQLLEGWDELGYQDVGGLLKKTATVLSSRIGGTSGPIWGTAFLRAGVYLADKPDPSHEDVVTALRASIDGIKARGNADLGDKTLLDALIPAVDRLEAELSGTGDHAGALAAAASTAREAADATKGMLAMRGRASYTGERSRDSPDAGAIGVAVMFEAVSEAWRTDAPKSSDGGES